MPIITPSSQAGLNLQCTRCWMLLLWERPSRGLVVVSPWPPGPSHSKPQTWSTSGQGDVGMGRVGEEGSLTLYTSFSYPSLLCRSCCSSHHPISPPLTPYHGNRCFKIFMWVTSPNPVNSPFLPFFPKSPLQVSAQDFVCSETLKTCIFHLWRKMICELYHLNWEIERGNANHI